MSRGAALPPRHGVEAISPRAGSSQTLPLSNGPLPVDQAARLRALIDSFEARPVAARGAQPAPVAPSPPPAPHPSHPRARVVAIASGKGGVGKTNASVNLCIALTQRGHRTTLLDADLGLANADVLCGLLPTKRLEQAVASLDPRPGSPTARSLSDIAIDAPGGFRLVPGSVGIARLAELGPDQRAGLLAGLADLERESDILVIDTAAGVGAGVLSMLNAADLGIVISTPEPTSIADAYALIKCLVTQDDADRRSDRLLRGLSDASARPGLTLVVNQATSAREAHAVHARIATVCQRFLHYPLPLLGWITQDPRVPAAVRARRPFLLHSPRATASHDVRVLAEALALNLAAGRSISGAIPLPQRVTRLLGALRPRPA